MRRLHSLFIKPTRECTARCVHCVARQAFYQTLRGDPLTLPEYAGLLEDARALGAGALHISGGEPLLFRELADLVRLGKGSGYFVILNTNGSLLTVPLAEELLDAGLDAVIVSIHAADPSVHDEIKRQPGSFGRAVRAVDILRAARERRGAPFFITTQTIVSRRNYEALPDVLDLVCRLGVDGHGLSYVEGDPEGGSLLDLADIARFRSQVLPQARARLRQHRFPNVVLKAAALGLLSGFYGRTGRTHRRLAAGRFRRASKRCYTPSVFAMVLDEGSVLPCNMTEYAGGPIMGNIRTSRLGDILGSRDWLAFSRHGFSGCERCPTHQHIHVPISVPLSALVRLALRNPGAEQKSVARRVWEAAR
jgi:MoaA/NifB/PqqE/SkfB family radical SAM enzyme